MINSLDLWKMPIPFALMLHSLKCRMNMREVKFIWHGDLVATVAVAAVTVMAMAAVSAMVALSY